MDVEKLIKILIADDNPHSRSGMRALLSTRPDFVITGEACDGLDAVQQVKQKPPDVVLMDVQMPRMDGITATRIITDLCPQVHIIILTLYENYLSEAMSAGASAFLTKGIPPDQLFSAIQSTAACS